MAHLDASVTEIADKLAPARCSTMVVDLDTDDLLVAIRPDLVMSTASEGKLLALVELAARAAAGREQLTSMVERTERDLVGDSGLWRYLQVPALSLNDLAVLIGAVSDNLATNVLVRYLGLESVQARAESLGLGAGLQLHDFVRDLRADRDPPLLSSGTARGLVMLFRWLWHDRLSTGTIGARVFEWLTPSADLSMVAGAFGLDPLARSHQDPGVRLWNKTGTDTGVRADAGVVEGPSRSIAYAMVINWAESDSSVGPSRNRILDAMRAVGTLLRAEVAPPSILTDDAKR